MKQANNVVTKPFLKQELRRGLYRLKSELKNDFLEKFDQVMGELKGIREDFDIFSGRYSEINDGLENHEERIKKLERKTAHK